ncbi:MAG: hypothetical protein KJ057_14395 [Phycisphaerae bacterium]|nr:hypothetical protein [Planctomycetia bacterium]MCK6465869.1 hypothetical protein [Phycisphaerae bacterium]MCL4719656.1 hypothetical protein [Phycisphaerae bacterium]NUQ10444.1 hypothetical protein [Phycisphaerae bacterium]
MKASTGAPDLDADARCAACEYILTGLPSSGTCPECGRGFDLADASTFLTDDPFMRWCY